MATNPQTKSKKTQVYHKIIVVDVLSLGGFAQNPSGSGGWWKKSILLMGFGGGGERNWNGRSNGAEIRDGEEIGGDLKGFGGL